MYPFFVPVTDTVKVGTIIANMVFPLKDASKFSYDGTLDPSKSTYSPPTSEIIHDE